MFIHASVVIHKKRYLEPVQNAERRVIINWLLAKLDKYGIKVIKGFEHDDNCKAWAK